MKFLLVFTRSASLQLDVLEKTDPKKWKKVAKCLALIEMDPRYPGLNSHRYKDYDEIHGEQVWESYVENNTPGAFRVFWHYGPKKETITILAITPHP